MRLPWPFGRGTTSGDASPASETVSGESHATAAPPVQREAPPTGAWASLPPIQRTVSAAPLVAPSAPFLSDVPGHRPLPPIVQPLGHEQVSTAPSGLVAAHAAPVATLTSSAAMPTRHVQRRTAEPAAPAWTGAGEPEAAASPAPSAIADLEPVRHVTAVAPSQAVIPPVRPLTVAPPISSSRPAVVQTSPDAGAVSPSAAASATTQPPAEAAALPLAPRGTPPARAGGRWSEGPAAAPRTGLGSPMTQVPATATPPAPAVQRTATSDAASNQPEPAAPAPRRAGLGAPIAAVPSTAIQRATPGLPLAHRIVAAHAASSDAAGPAALPTTMPGGHGQAVSGADRSGAPLPPARPLPVLPVARRADASPTAIQRATGPTSPAPVQRSTVPRAAAPEAPPHPVLPLLGARPLRPSVIVQRETDGASSSDAEPASLPVAARWGAPGELPDTIGAAELPSPVADAVPLQRLAAPEPAAAPAPAGPVEWTAAGGWRGAHSPSLGSPSQPGAGVPAAQRLPSPALPSTPRRSTPANQGPAPSLQLARPPQATAPAPAPATAAAPIHNRIEAPAVTTSALAPTVQMSPAAAPSLPVFTATPVVQRVEGTAPQGDTGAPARTDKELDELAKQLFGRLRGQIRAEVITEREARGLGFDAF